MKKTYTTIKTFVVLLSLLAFNLSAQISGTVTIDNSQATGGTNYQTFGALASALNTSGINGNLVVDVMTGTNSGVYNEQVSFNQITGMSANQRVTINGNGCLLTFNCQLSAPYVMQLNGTDYLSVNNLRMQSTNSTYGLICMLVNSSNYNNFTACSFSCATNNVTSTQSVPWAISASATGLSCCSAQASYNTVTSCTLFSGGYSVYHYGNSGTPRATNNSFINCRITDWYSACVYGYYARNLLFKGCTFDRDTRTTFTTMYFNQGWYQEGCVYDGNTFRNFYGGNLNATNTCYFMYYWGYYQTDMTNRNVFRNNIVKDIIFNGTFYGAFYNYYQAQVDYYHNTWSWDYTNTNTGTVYIYYYCYPYYGAVQNYKNNLYSFTCPGSATRMVYYSPGSPMANIDKNDYNLTAPNASYGNVTSQATSLSAWQSQGYDANSYSLAPQYANYAAGDLHPTNTLLNDLGTPLNIAYDNINMPRSQSVPDIGALEFLSNNCSGTPSSSNTVVTPTAPICPNESANLMLQNWTSDIGITYQWLASTTSSAGPWTTINGENTVYYTTPGLNATTYYGVAITCTNAVGSVTIAGAVNIATTVISQVPYFESFEGIGQPNKLPNCSWSSSTPMGGTCLTYTSSNTQNRMPLTGNSFASFYYSPAGSNYFYTNGIQLNAGITYSASVWYTTEYYGYNNWTDLSIMVGPNQSTTGLVTIASSNGPAISNIYKSLSNTFTVATSGIYYVAVKATANTSSFAYYLTWDDLAITIPCQLNSPTIALTANSTTLCAGEELMLNASGADTYTWTNGTNMGATTSSVSEYPNYPSVFGVTGSSSLTGCSSTQTISVLVNPSPQVLLYANTTSVCAGQPVNLTAFGAGSYNWNPVPSTSQMITVNPNVTTTYSVIGTDPSGCTGMAVQTITVNPLPTINVTQSAPNTMCVDDRQTLTASGAASYIWVSSASGNVMQGSPLAISNLPVGAVSFTVTGTDAFGCTSTQVVVQNVDACTGIASNGALSGLNVYPNPTSAELVVELNNNLVKTVVVTDLTGRVVLTAEGSNNLNLDMSNLANGVYYVKVSSDKASEVVKVVKQ